MENVKCLFPFVHHMRARPMNTTSYTFIVCFHSILLQFVFYFYSFCVIVSVSVLSILWCVVDASMPRRRYFTYRHSAWVISIIGRQSIFSLWCKMSRRRALAQPQVEQKTCEMYEYDSINLFHRRNHLTAFCYTWKILFVNQKNRNTYHTIRPTRAHRRCAGISICRRRQRCQPNDIHVFTS